MDPTSRPAVFIDNGTGYTKMAFAVQYSAGVMADLDFFIGDEALTQSRSSNNYNITHTIKHGKLDNWDAME
ncbi:hypothetical protein GOBAR_AA22788 [Gossypium barbadense]|uniref:Uncharacterized protein n=1 Tax=Gossypium barbadense TaxID=3634 RepID=A0A2P5X3I1_GOSBA|nr:hypothetical protein GOBAR_AA22787 [Gossypium barbadense]PPR97883.1 hypothetical protein GOBAR_AA22788 [Gossypium barbadense]